MILVYDGTLQGLLTVFAYGRSLCDAPVAIEKSSCPSVGLFDRVEEVDADREVAESMRHRICAEISVRAMDNIRLAFLSEHPGIELFLWRYLALGWKLGSGLDSCLAHPDVHAIHCWARKTAREAHRLKGLIRFREVADGSLYGPFHADANVLPLLAPHFSRRIDRPWALCDTTRSLGAIGREGRYLLGGMMPVEGVPSTPAEQHWQLLWKGFHRSIAIPERVSPRRQRQFMPMKYWDFLVEMDTEHPEGLVHPEGSLRQLSLQ
jgi:probable DNA metabolism protein